MRNLGSEKWKSNKNKFRVIKSKDIRESLNSALFRSTKSVRARWPKEFTSPDLLSPAFTCMAEHTLCVLWANAIPVVDAGPLQHWEGLLWHDQAFAQDSQVEQSGSRTGNIRQANANVSFPGFRSPEIMVRKLFLTQLILWVIKCIYHIYTIYYVHLHSFICTSICILISALLCLVCLLSNKTGNMEWKKGWD